MAKQKYYVVWKGAKTGVFDNWKECEEQVKNYKNPVYKSFKTKELADEAFAGKSSDYIGKTEPTSDLSPSERKQIGKPNLESISVDAACSGNPGTLEYRGVYTRDGRELFHQGPFESGTNNIGEFLAIAHGLAYLKKHNLSLPIYSDSQNAINWVKDKQIRTKHTQNKKNAELFSLMERALKWLKENEYSTPVMKWETKAWGEIPADFGRK